MGLHRWNTRHTEARKQGRCPRCFRTYAGTERVCLVCRAREAEQKRARYAERRRDPDAEAARALRQQETALLTFARQHGLRREEAQRFFARQRGSLLRQRLQQVVNDTGPLIAHCNGWHPITALPLVLPCCGKVVLVLEEKVGV